MSIERIFVAMLVDGYDEEVVADRDRTVLRLHPQIAPVKAAILPLIARNDEMVSKARALQDELRHRHMVEYDDGGQIGRRYRRQDEIGTPWAFTIDDQTLEDDTVTVRDRDSLAQERLPLAGVRSWLEDALEHTWAVSSPKLRTTELGDVPLHCALVRAEAELLVQRVRVARVQHPAAVGVRPVLDDLAHELDAEPAAAALVEHVDVGEVDEARADAVDGARAKPTWRPSL